MQVEELQLVNFRSYKERVFKFNPKITIIEGPNGSGKTNLLEGIYVLALAKSFRAKDRDLIKHKSKYYRLSAIGSAGKATVAYGLKGDKRVKKVIFNNKQTALAKYIGKLKIILFEPGDLDIITGPPEKRRQFIDIILSQTDINYLKTLLNYKRLLKQRNRLLTDGRIDKIKDQIFVWDLKLTEEATEIYQKRIELINYFNNIISNYYNQITKDKENIKIRYQTNIDNSDNYESSFLKQLVDNLDQDIRNGFTTIGPHREDFRLIFNNLPAELVASRGEVRTIVLALKLAEANYLKDISKEQPLLLLDDVFSELDNLRKKYLVKQLQNYQTIITTTDIDAIKGQFKSSVDTIKLKI